MPSVRLGIILWGLLLSWTAQSEAPKVLVSIRPLALIVEAIAQRDADVKVLIEGAASPHHFSLRISDMEKVANADVIVWVGPEMEPYLAKPLARQTTITLSQLDKITSAGLDPHYWLSLNNARQLAQAVTTFLVQQDKSKEAIYLERLEKFDREIVAADTAFSAQFAVKQTSFIAYHNSLGHLVNIFGLHQLGVLAEVPDQQVGAKTLHYLLQIKDQADCLIAESGEMPEAKRYGQRLNLPVVSIDLLAVDKNYASYAQYLQDLASSVTKCALGNK